jgi:hypothetical protein
MFLRCLTDSILGVRSSGLRAVRLTILPSQRLSLSQQAFERENGASAAAIGRNAYVLTNGFAMLSPFRFLFREQPTSAVETPSHTLDRVY